MSEQFIRCERHGIAGAVMSCEHIGEQACRCIYINPADEEYPEQAWCDICEDARIKDRGWNDYADSVANWCWICTVCLHDATKRTAQVVQVANPTAPSQE